MNKELNEYEVITDECGHETTLSLSFGLLCTICGAKLVNTYEDENVPVQTN